MQENHVHPRKRLFVTGATGFVGRWLQRLVSTAPLSASVEWVTPAIFCDIREQIALTDQLRGARPDWIIHLAAQSAVPQSFRDPSDTFDVNCLGTISLLQAMKSSGFSGRLLYVGSADAYGLVPPEALPVSESRPLSPRNPYAVSKAAGELLCRQWVLTEKADIVLARPFNHIGPGQSPQFVIASFAQQIARIRAGISAPVIDVGDIDTTRDFSDVRDVVDAYIALLEHGEKGEVYNVCSGVETRVGDALDVLIKIAQLDVSIREDKERQRISEQRRMVGSHEKCALATGWAPRHTLAATLEDIWQDAMRQT